ncbi:MAG: TRAP transporter large permease [Bacillota bacterium]|nr:TRAP transporter large permease [Bacillota bacterium]
MTAYVFAVFLITLLVGVPIGISIALSSLVPSMVLPSFAADAVYVFRSMITGIDSFTLLAIPLFVLSGNLMAASGISKKIFDFIAYFAGNKTGGLPIAIIATCLFYGAICGSAGATVAAVGVMTIPILVNFGYEKNWVVAIVAVAGSLGVIIPPSIPFIVFGVATGESVGDLFIAGIIPGIIMGLCMMLYAYYYCKKKGEDKEKLLENYVELRKMSFWQLFKNSFWALLSPVIILGGIYGGIVTPTEAADVSVVYALIVGCFIYRSLSIKDIIRVTKDSICSIGPLMVIMSAGLVFGRVLTLMQVPQQLTETLLSMVSTPVGVFLILIGFCTIVGMLMDGLVAIMILAPICMPIVNAVGIDPIHFGVVMVITFAIGFITPPIGANLFVASRISDVPVLSIAKKAVPAIISFIVALLIVTFIPELSLVLLK